MSWQARCTSLLKSALRRQRMEQDMDAEMRFHVTSYTEDLVRSGISRQEAERMARIEFGRLEPIKEDCRQARGLRLLDETMQDLRYAGRMLRKSPGFAAVAVLTLALGIGANTSIFSIVDAWILKPLPYPESSRLVSVFTADVKRNQVGSTSPADLYDWRQDNQAFETICAFSTPIFTLMRGDQPEQIVGSRVNTEFFQMLGVRPQLGRGFLAQEDQPGAEPVAMISHALWQSHFAAERGIVGKLISVNGRSTTIIGVLPASFHLPLMGRSNVWMPFAFSEDELKSRGLRYLDVIGRVKPGVPFTRAAGSLNAVARRLEQTYPATNKGKSVQLHTVQEEIGKQGGSEQALIIFWLVGCVLLIACVNVANLIVGRAVNRQREMSVRLAIGAGKARLLRQLLTENLVLFLCAAAVSVLFAVWGVRWIAQSIPHEVRQYLPNQGVLQVNSETLLYTLAIALVTGLLFGFAPAVHCWRIDISHNLKTGTSRISAHSGGTRLKNSLIVGEVSLALVVLVASGLLVNSLLRMYASDPGFNPNGLVTAQVVLSDAKYNTRARVTDFYSRLVEQMQSLPGVKSAAAVLLIPYSGSGNQTRYAIDGQQPAAPDELPLVRLDVTTPGYFAAMEIPLVRGRLLSEEDRQETLPVAVINQTMAQRHWLHDDPIGKRVRYGVNLKSMLTIVGVVKDTKGQNETDLAQPEIYVPHKQLPARSMRLVIRAGPGAGDLANGIRQATMAVDKEQAVAEIQTMDQMMEQMRAPLVVVGKITSFFAGLTLFLAALGIYGVMVYSVAARKQEFGIRMALGAARRDLVSLVVGQGLKLASIGMLIGLAGAFGVTRLLAFMLYQVSPTDATTFVCISLLFLAVAALACYLPARRASSVDPTIALRCE